MQGKMHGKMHIVLAGVRRLVHVRDRTPRGADLRTERRRICVEFEADNTDHMALGRDLHMAIEDEVLLVEDGSGWQSVGMSSTLDGADAPVRQFRVELVEVDGDRDASGVLLEQNPAMGVVAQ